jgi:hypothetical protein
LLTLIGFCTADLFPTEEAYNFIFSFVETGNFDEAFAEAEYDGANFVVMMGTVGVFVAIGIASGIVRSIILYIAIKTNSCKKIIEKFPHASLVDTLTRFFLEELVDLGICSLISTYAVYNRASWCFENAGMTFASILGIYVVIIIAILPFYMFLITEIYNRN